MRWRARGRRLGQRSSSQASTPRRERDVGRGQRRCRGARRFIGGVELRGARGVRTRTSKSDGEGARRPRRATEADMFRERAWVRGTCVLTCGRLGIRASVFPVVFKRASVHRTGSVQCQIYGSTRVIRLFEVFALRGENEVEKAGGTRVSLGGDARAETMSTKTNWSRRYATYLLCAGAGYYGTTRPRLRVGSPILSEFCVFHAFHECCAASCSTPHPLPSLTRRLVSDPPLCFDSSTAQRSSAFRSPSARASSRRRRWGTRAPRWLRRSSSRD